MSSQKRRYTLKARAEHQAETRRRIVEATSALHQEVGPVQTTVAEIARRAGVQRLTVYNNFPDESELFSACSAHWLTQNPPPDFSTAFAIEDPATRLRATLGPLYAYYRRTEDMVLNIERDRMVLRALDAVVKAGTDTQMIALAGALTAGFQLRAESVHRVRAAVALALDFWTWRRLTKEGLSDEAAANLMVDSVTAVAAG